MFSNICDCSCNACLICITFTLAKNTGQYSDGFLILLRFTDQNVSDIMSIKESQRAKAATLYYGGANPSGQKKGGRCQWLQIQSL